jgi:hypothetical protein
MKYILIVIATVFVGESEEPKVIKVELPQASYEECMSAKENYELDIPFPFISFKIESECVVEQGEPSESIKT